MEDRNLKMNEDENTPDFPGENQENAAKPNKYLVVCRFNNIDGRTFVCSGCDVLAALLELTDQLPGGQVDDAAAWNFMRRMRESGAGDVEGLVKDYNVFSKESQNMIRITNIFRINAQLYDGSDKAVTRSKPDDSRDRTNVQEENKHTNVRSGEDELRTYVLFRSKIREDSGEDRDICCVEAPDLTSAMINIGKIPVFWSDVFPVEYMKELLEAAEDEANNAAGDSDYSSRLADIYNKYSKYSRIEEIYEAAEMLYPNKCLDTAAGCFRYQNSPAYFYNNKQ